MLTEKDYKICRLSTQETTALKLLGYKVSLYKKHINHPYALEFDGIRAASFSLVDNKWDVTPNDKYFKHRRVLEEILGPGRAF